MKINLCLGCPPAPVYKGGREEEAGPKGWHALGGAILLQVGLPPPFPIRSRRRKEEGRVLSMYPRRPTAEALTQHRGSSRTSSRSNRSKHRYSGTSEFLTHVQLDDTPRAPIQQSFGEEFCQHDGVVTILMFNCRRASPKHHYNMIEV